MTTKQAKTKPKCIRGTPCGYSCISAKRQCSDRIKARDAAELLASVKQAAETKPTGDFDLDSVPKYGPTVDLDRELETEVGKHNVVVILSTVYDSQEPLDTLDITVRVNEELDSGESGVPKEDAAKVALAAARATLKAISQLPDGVLVRNAPYDGDSSFEARKRMYQKMGFSEYDADTQEQYGIVYKGKVRPLSYDEFSSRRYD